MNKYYIIALLIVLTIIYICKKNNSAKCRDPRKCIDNSCPEYGKCIEDKCVYNSQDKFFQYVANMDIVYMWVDGSDTQWQNNTNSKLNSRNRNNDELKFSLRSIEKYMPWHKGKIFIVTPNQTPKWLKNKNNIHIINQNDILPQEAIPTSNSFVIEIFLYKIPRLSKNFIYMNDDYMLSSYISPKDLFEDFNKPIFYKKNFQIKCGLSESDYYLKQKKKIWLSATCYTNSILNKSYGKKKRYYMSHAPYCLNKIYCHKVYIKWKKYFDITITHKKRHWKDAIMVLLYRYYIIHEDKPHKLINNNDILFQKITDNKLQNNLYFNKIKNKCLKLFVLNDEFNKEDTGLQMKSFLDVFYPEHSKYE